MLTWSPGWRVGDSDDDDEEKAIYNPKNLPLGCESMSLKQNLHHNGPVHLRFHVVNMEQLHHHGPEHLGLRLPQLS